MADPSRFALVPYGEPAVRALIGMVATAQRYDPLAPVTVVVSSATAGVTLRRRLAGGSGIASVRLVSMPQLAEQLAVPVLARERRLPLSGVRRSALVRAVLADAPGLFAGVADSSITESTLAGSFTELRTLEPDQLDTLAGRSRRAADVVRLYRSFRAAAGEWADDVDVLGAASRAVRDSPAALDEVGVVVVYLPRRLTRAEVDLLSAVADRDQLRAVIGLTGSLTADATTSAVVDALHPLLGPPDSRPAPAAPHGDLVVRVPDPAEEVVVAVRLVVDWLAEGVPPERIGVAYRLRDPYATIAHEQLTAAGVAHHGPSVRTLAQTVTGRVLLGLLALPDHDYRRAEVMQLLRSAPIREPGRGSVPVHRWDGMTRRAGVVAGVDQWRARLEILRQSYEQRLEETLATEADQVAAGDVGAGVLPGESVAPEAGHVDGGALPVEPLDEVAAGNVDAGVLPGESVAPEVGDVGSKPLDRVARAVASLTERLDDLDRLRSFIDSLASATDPGDRRGWASLTSWARTLIDSYLGPEAATTRWPDEERGAHHAVLSLIDQLGALESSGSDADVAVFRRVVRDELERPAGSVGRLGHGVVVARLADLVGADLDRIVVLGLAEGTFPPAGRDDALVPDREWPLPASTAVRHRLTRAEEERDYLAALASAPFRVLTFPVGDPRHQRERQPARWLLDTCSALAGHRLYGLDLARLAAARVPWFRTVESFEWWLGEGHAPATSSELGLADLLVAHRRHRPLAAVATVAADPDLARGLEAGAARRDGVFGPWTGRIGAHPTLRDDLGHPRSATSLQDWAVCPFRYFLRHALNVGSRYEPADAETIDSLERGSLVHAILEEFLASHLGRAPDEPWTADDRRRALAVAEQRFTALEAEGRTGRPLLWEMEKASIRRNLLRILAADDLHRAGEGLVPVAVEHGFGFDGDDQSGVEIPLSGNRVVRFRGFIDRIDRSVDGTRLVVLDYKTGRPYDAHQRLDPDAADHDVTASGTLLQLPIYAHAARLAHGDVRVDARYWFIGARGRIEQKGAPIDERSQERFQQVLEVIADGVEHGRFPARPGPEAWRVGGWTHENCRYCEYDALCPTTRSQAWARIRDEPELADYVELAEPGRR